MNGKTVKLKRYNASNNSWTIEIIGDPKHAYILYQGIPSKNLVAFTSNVAVDNDFEQRDPSKYQTLTLDHLIGRKDRSESAYVQHYM